MMDYEKRLNKSRWFGIRNKFEPRIQLYRFAHFYIGFNLVYQEATEPRGMLKIPLPFFKHDHAFLRYKKIIFNKSNIQIFRIEQKIAKIKAEIEKGGDKYGLLTMMIRMLEEVQYGVAKTPEMKK